jgi:glycerol-3-phosphate dehydrogenase
MNRVRFIKELHQQPETVWEIIVIGGGATGMGIALDAASRGYKTLLIEQSDFGKGTSSRSTKLVHGGVRYMAQGDLFLVMEALHERGLLIKNAPHLTSNQQFIIPVYNWWDAFKYTFGLKFYDLLAGRLSMGKSFFINRKKTLLRLPRLLPAGLIGGVIYHDGLFDDSRMVMSLARACVDKGGLILNYFKATGLLKDTAGKITGVSAREMVSGEDFNLKARIVINATGVFADNVVRMDNPVAVPSIRPSQGIHIVLDKSFLESESALMIPKTDDRRVLFAIPWYNEVLVGTTDTPLNGIKLEPVALEEEIDFILKTAGKYLVKPPERKDILSIFAGLRPLAADPGNAASTKEVSRRHKITISPSGLLTIIGGKWTTYRRMAEETIDKAISTGFLERKICITRNLMLSDVSENSTHDRFRIYGNGMDEIKNLIKNNPELGLTIDPRLPYTQAEMIWICRNEMPITIEDLLARRTRALFLNARASMDMASAVAGIMAVESGYDMKWQKDQVDSYSKLVNNYIQI